MSLFQKLIYEMDDSLTYFVVLNWPKIVPSSFGGHFFLVAVHLCESFGQSLFHTQQNWCCQSLEAKVTFYIFKTSFFLNKSLCKRHSHGKGLLLISCCVILSLSQQHLWIWESGIEYWEGDSKPAQLFLCYEVATLSSSLWERKPSRPPATTGATGTATPTITMPTPTTTTNDPKSCFKLGSAFTLGTIVKKRRLIFETFNECVSFSFKPTKHNEGKAKC